MRGESKQEKERERNEAQKGHSYCGRYTRNDNRLFRNYDWMPAESSHVTIIYV